MTSKKYQKVAAKKSVMFECNVVIVARAIVTYTKSLRQIQLVTTTLDATNHVKEKTNVDINANVVVTNAKMNSSHAMSISKRNWNVVI
jgi:hypothetical protein